MDDYIKRKDVHLAFDSYYFPGELSLRETINSVPSADVVPVMQGAWVKNGWSIRCSVCGYDMPFATRNFCPNCGADMRKEN